MPAQRTAAALVAGALAVAAGCGDSAKHYVKQDVANCLARLSYEVDTKANNLSYIGQAAAEGALKATSGSNSIEISFERDAHDAEDTKSAYEAFRETGSPLVERRANAVLAWDLRPTDSERSGVERCLD